MSFIACKQDSKSHQLTSLRIVPLCGQGGREAHICRTVLEEIHYSSIGEATH
jgi:hypothetical protein